MFDRTIKLLVFNRSGHTCHYPNYCSCSGYDRPEQWNPSEGESIPIGTPCLDIRAAVDTTEGFSWVFKGPLVDVDIELGDIDRCPEPSPIMATAMAGTEYGSLLAMHSACNSKAAGPLDAVSVGEYILGWVDHNGIAGTWNGTSIDWGNNNE